MSRTKLIGSAAAVVSSVFLAGLFLAGPAAAFTGKSVSAANCDYGGKIKSIEATAEFNVRFTLCAPDPAFMAKAAFTPFGIQPEEHLAATGGGGDILENPIGTGPWKLQKWSRGDSIIFKRFDDYWGKKPVYETLVIRWSDSGAGRLIELRSGTVDQITNPSPDDYESIQNDASLKFIPVSNPNILYLAMTNTFKPFDNVRVRQAIAMGIDRQRIVDNFFPSGSEVASHFTPCSIDNGCEGKTWYDFDPELARATWHDAAYPTGLKTKIFFRDVFRGRSAARRLGTEGRSRWSPVH